MKHESLASPITPDGRYLIVRDRLWRRTNPNLDAEQRQKWVNALMECRRNLRRVSSPRSPKEMRAKIDELKRLLGERGPVWWTDESPDYNRYLVRNTPYRDWYEQTTHQCEKPAVKR